MSLFNRLKISLTYIIKCNFFPFSYKGTTVTGILSAFTSPSSTLKKSLQLAFVYTFFNTLGVLFWLPIPPLRFPKRYSRKLGSVVFQYRWFIYCYVSALYFIGPLIMLGLALIPMWIGLAIVGIPLILAGLALLIIMLLRRFVPKVLPEKLKDFGWLPLWMRSLKPYDEKFKRMSVRLINVLAILIEYKYKIFSIVIKVLPSETQEGVGCGASHVGRRRHGRDGRGEGCRRARLHPERHSPHERHRQSRERGSCLRTTQHHSKHE